MAITDELRRMLDERGVEWMPSVWSAKDETFYKVGEVGYLATEMSSGRMKVGIEGYPTTEQAIAATLGSSNCSNNCTNSERTGTCRDVRTADHTIAFECSECGCWVAYDEYWETGIYVPHETGQEHIHPRYCPNCGRKVVE